MPKGMMDSIAAQSLRGLILRKERKDRVASSEGVVDQQDIPPFCLQLEGGDRVEVSHD